MPLICTTAGLEKVAESSSFVCAKMYAGKDNAMSTSTEGMIDCGMVSKLRKIRLCGNPTLSGGLSGFEL
jgi:hypothetical protein